MSFKDLKSGAAKAAPAPDSNAEVAKLKAQLAALTQAAAKVTVQTDAEPIVIETAEGTPIDTTPPGNFLSLMTGGDTIDALLATIETDGGGGFASPYPVLTQAAGVTGGAFQRVMIKAHMAVDLPEGRSPFEAVFVGYRLHVVAWPKGYDEKATTKDKPVFSAAIPANKSDLASNLMMAGHQYQYSKNRDAWSIASHGPGHIRPELELLLMDPSDCSLFVFRCAGHYNSAKDTRDQLLRQATAVPNSPKKQLVPFFGSFSPKTIKVQAKSGNTVVYHYPEIDKIDTTDARAVKAAGVYRKFIQTADADVQSMALDWLAGKDEPLTPAIEAAILAGSQMP
jgi:hypothetical protein